MKLHFFQSQAWAYIQSCNLRLKKFIQRRLTNCKAEYQKNRLFEISFRFSFYQKNCKGRQKKFSQKRLPKNCKAEYQKINNLRFHSDSVNSNCQAITKLSNYQIHFYRKPKSLRTVYQTQIESKFSKVKSNQNQAKMLRVKHIELKTF